jgi:SOS response regulatory protein OraA/RecX
MPKAKNPLTPEEQRKRFEAEVRKRIEDGELSPTEAESALDRLVRKGAKDQGQK